MDNLYRLEESWYNIRKKASIDTQNSQTIKECTKHMATLIVANKNYDRVKYLLDSRQKTS